MRPEAPAESRGEISFKVWSPEQFVIYLHCPPCAGPLSSVLFAWFPTLGRITGVVRVFDPAGKETAVVLECW